MQKQKVTLTVTEGEKVMTLEREIWNEWPGRVNPSIEDLINDVAREVITQIREAEGR